MDINSMNVAVLAYVGDSVYELEIRSYLVKKRLAKVNELQKLKVDYVSANAQEKILNNLLDKNIFTKEELYNINRSRNYKPNSKPKHTSIKTYKAATSLEALFGMLYLQEKETRIKEIINEIIGD